MGGVRTPRRGAIDHGNGHGGRAAGRKAEALADRPACGDRILELVRPGDRVIVMGARDDTLSTFAAELLQRIKDR